jgi:hypothetical protein
MFLCFIISETIKKNLKRSKIHGSEIFSKSEGPFRNSYRRNEKYSGLLLYIAKGKKKLKSLKKFFFKSIKVSSFNKDVCSPWKKPQKIISVSLCLFRTLEYERQRLTPKKSRLPFWLGCFGCQQAAGCPKTQFLFYIVLP